MHREHDRTGRHVRRWLGPGLAPAFRPWTGAPGRLRGEAGRPAQAVARAGGGLLAHRGGSLARDLVPAARAHDARRAPRQGQGRAQGGVWVSVIPSRPGRHHRHRALGPRLRGGHAHRCGQVPYLPDPGAPPRRHHAGHLAAHRPDERSGGRGQRRRPARDVSQFQPASAPCAANTS